MTASGEMPCVSVQSEMTYCSGKTGMQWPSFIKLVAIAAVLWPVVTQAQTYPSRPIVMVVPFAAGGTFDVMGRLMASRMSELLGQQVIVENVTGAGGVIGTNRVVNAAPDGYTLLLGSTGTHAYNQTIYKKRRYDAVNDFTPVTLWSEQPMVLETRKDLPANTIPEFAALLKSNSAKMQFGSAGAGSTTHLACSLLNAVIGVNVTHVPYRGSAPASTDLMSGQIDYLCGNLGAAAPLIIGKQVKAIAVLSKERSPLMPELASAHEQGLKDFDITSWTAFFLPKGTPKAIVDKLNEVTHATMETPLVKTRMLEIGVTGVGPDRRSPEYLANFVASEIKRWERPIIDAGLQVD
jgi:tripartite-type tricarboxylate transporter receptor subunit TctC